jgi:hypothetical protein
VQCDFLLTHRGSDSASPGSGFPSTNTPSSNPYPPGGKPTFGSGAPVPQNGFQAPNLNLYDLELLHNYSTHTSSTLQSDPMLKNIMRVSVPQLGLEYEFVMRGVLALSAIHLARFKPDRRDFYISQAMEHHQTGLRLATSILPNITEENCSAVYIFSALTLYFTLASPRKPGDFLIMGENGISDWLFLLKGTNFIIQASQESLYKGPFGPMFLNGKRREDFRQAQLSSHPPEEDPLSDLHYLVSKTVTSPHHLAILTSAIDDLRKSFIVYSQGIVFETSDIFIWLFRVQDDYLELLKRHSQEALVIFAYFCVILKRLDHHWWIEGWSTHLVEKIWGILDEEHRLWVRWPIEEIGWIPN